MERAWHIFRIVFSLLLVLWAIHMFVTMNFSDSVPFSPYNIGVPVGLVFFAAIPWVLRDSQKNYKATGLMGIVFSIGFISMTVAGFKDEIDFPMSCSPRSQIGCDLMNWLYGNYGSNSVGLLLLLVSSFIVVGSIKLIGKKL